MSDAAKKLKGTTRVQSLADEMLASGLWEEKGQASMFLAAIANLAGSQLPDKLEGTKDIVNFYSLQPSANDVGELAAFHLIAGGSTVDDTMVRHLPLLMEAGAGLVEPIIGKEDTLDQLEGIIEILEKHL